MTTREAATLRDLADAVQAVHETVDANRRELNTTLIEQRRELNERLDGLQEILNTQATTMMPRDEYDRRHEALLVDMNHRSEERQRQVEQVRGEVGLVRADVSSLAAGSTSSSSATEKTKLMFFSIGGLVFSGIVALSYILNIVHAF